MSSSQFSAEAAPFVPPGQGRSSGQFSPSAGAEPFVPAASAPAAEGFGSPEVAYQMWVQQMLAAGHSMADIEFYSMPGAAAPRGRGGRGSRGRGRGASGDASALLPGGYAKRRKAPKQQRTVEETMGWAPMVRPSEGANGPRAAAGADDANDDGAAADAPARGVDDDTTVVDPKAQAPRRRAQRGGGVVNAAWSAEQQMLARHAEAQDYDEPDLPKVETPNGTRLALGVGEPPEKHTAVLLFKRGRLRQYECTSAITCGEYAIVESSAGSDCALVVLRTTYAWDGSVRVEELEGADALSCKLPLEAGSVKRMATEEETELVQTYLPRLEQQALNLFRLRCRGHGYNAAIVEDCEMQFDGRRITFFYDADGEHEFREAVREVAMTYNARVWLDNLNPAANSRPAARNIHLQQQREQQQQNERQQQMQQRAKEQFQQQQLLKQQQQAQ
uniref:PSP1 C-terminal domain-containing protein n=1 Tax=Neobodo designis TaxID=312471 RepID=A0A7S1L1X8_NEODS|mmetsp:Transcript_12974/g.40285  ORF Transcript_12974/g.40285 Transcript_12974/m.40285 type:complete len:446 (+) Transcript_12974:50-1387(+)